MDWGVIERFWDKVDGTAISAGFTPCWEWAAGRTAAGYGAFHPTKHTTVLAHRFAYEDLVGPIPEGLQIDHLMEPVTQAENIRRGESPPARNARKTHCPRGHALTSDNLTKRADGSRDCMACFRLRRQGAGNP